ncbi:unnamed protein product, partial [Rotaria magnacalcarata]
MNETVDDRLHLIVQLRIVEEALRNSPDDVILVTRKRNILFTLLNENQVELNVQHLANIIQ